MAKTTVPQGRDAEHLGRLLDSPEVATLVAELQATHWTGRPGYPIRAMVGLALTKALYAIPTWTRVVALATEHAALRTALGCADADSVPSIDACYWFTLPLRVRGLDRVRLHADLTKLGQLVVALAKARAVPLAA